MVLYQADIIDEELAIQWGTHVSKKYVDKETSKKVRKSAEAFVAVSLQFLRASIWGWKLMK
jgi:translation initiation factor 5